jgi:hypothetical protein
VFGSTGLVLGSSMALIPPETILIFYEGKSTNSNYNMIVHESNPSHYQLSADIIVIHRRFISYKTLKHWLTHLFTLINLAETHTHLQQSRCSASVGVGSSFTGNHQSWHRMLAGVDSIFSTTLEHRNKTIYS